jgi:hypothetical protein
MLSNVYRVERRAIGFYGNAVNHDVLAANGLGLVDFRDARSGHNMHAGVLQDLGAMFSDAFYWSCNCKFHGGCWVCVSSGFAITISAHADRALFSRESNAFSADFAEKTSARLNIRIFVKPIMNTLHLLHPKIVVDMIWRLYYPNLLLV